MISIIIPTYNERGNISSLVDKIEKELKLLKETAEVIFVDDNSLDLTWKLIQAMARKKKFVKLIKRKGKLGLTSAILEGLKKSRGDKIIIMDADLSHPVEKLSDIAYTLNSFDLVVMSRFVPGGGVKHWPIHRKLISFGATFLSKIILGVKGSDPMSGFFGIRKASIKGIKFKTKGYKVLLNLLVSKKKLKIKELPYVFQDRYKGETKLGNHEILIYLRDILSLRR